MMPTKAQSTNNPIALQSIDNDLYTTVIIVYGRHFLAFGYQQLRNTRLSQSRRNVFYLQKITVE